MRAAAGCGVGCPPPGAPPVLLAAGGPGGCAGKVTRVTGMDDGSAGGEGVCDQNSAVTTITCTAMLDAQTRGRLIRWSGVRLTTPKEAGLFRRAGLLGRLSRGGLPFPLISIPQSRLAEEHDLAAGTWRK